MAITADRARNLTTTELRGALRDINATLHHSDALDARLGGDRGGKYRDEASIVHAELARREKATAPISGHLDEDPAEFADKVAAEAASWSEAAGGKVSDRDRKALRAGAAAMLGALMGKRILTVKG